MRWLRPASDPQAATLTKYKALVAAGAAVGQAPIAPHVAVSFADTTNPAGIAQPACTRCGDCCAGCNVGAKNTVALTYLPDAVQHGAQLFTHIRVSHIAPLANARWPDFLPGSVINLGLDLAGGSHILLEAKPDQVTRQRRTASLVATHLIA